MKTTTLLTLGSDYLNYVFTWDFFWVGFTLIQQVVEQQQKRV